MRLPPNSTAYFSFPRHGVALAVVSSSLAALGQTEPAAPEPASSGAPVSEDVSVVSWTAGSKDAALADAHVDEFMLRGTLPHASGPLWFKVLQTCENGSADWRETPATGPSTKGLKSPAVLLEVTGGPAEASAPAAKPAAASHGAHQH